jgi:hypothetical protein
MEFFDLFPTTIFKGYNKVLAESLLPLCNKYTSEETIKNCLDCDNFPSTLSAGYLEFQVNNNEPLVTEALQYISDHCLKPFLAHRGIGLPGPIRPFGFFSSMEKGGYLRKHHHLDCYFSGIVYLEVGEDVPELILHHPGNHIKFLHYPSDHQHIDNYLNRTCNVFKIKPETGMILLWDASIEHELNLKTNDNPRKTFVFNL